MRRELFFPGCALFVLLLLSLLLRPDIPVDETRYVSVAWEAWQSGDWLVMHMNGVPYHHKPPLLFWLTGLGWSVFGVGAWWPRTLSALASLACVALTVALARRLWPQQRNVDQRAAAFLLAGFFWLAFSTAVMFDVLLTAFVLLALYAVLRAEREGGRGNWLLLGLAVGLGILTKGPFIVLYVLPVALSVRWWGQNGESPKGWWQGIFAAATLALAIALLWVVPAAILGGEEFRQAILWRQVAGRVSGELAHRQPFWFYLAALLILFFPLCLLRQVWSGLFAQLRRLDDRATRFVLSWTMPAFLALSVSAGKQIHYILPLWPAFVLLLAAGWTSRKPALPFLLPALFVLIGLGLLFHPLWISPYWLAAYAGPAWSWAGLALLVLALALPLFLKRWPERQPSLLAGFAMTVMAVLLLGVVHGFAPAFDTTPTADRLRELESAGMEVVHVSAYNDQFRYYGRLSRPLPEIGRNDLPDWFRAHPDGRALVYVKRAGDLRQLVPLFSQPYLSGGLALIGAESLSRWQALAVPE